MTKREKPSERIQVLLKTIYEDCQKEDTSVRERQVRQWRRLKLLWEGYQRIWYDDVAHDWRIWGEEFETNVDQASYDKPINVFKSYLESIIAALSVIVPPIKCFPDDADNPLDQATARAGDKISQLVYRHNNAPLLWLHALFIFCTEGMTACYSYTDESTEYGTWKENKYEDVEEQKNVVTCSVCGETIDEQPDEFDPSIEEQCPYCQAMMLPHQKQEVFVTTRLVGTTSHPKSRQCLEFYGGLNVKVSNYAKNQKQISYLTLSQEIDYVLALDEYDLDKDEIQKAKADAGSYYSYAQWARLSPQYQGEFPINVVTRSKCWIRPRKYNILDEEGCAELKKEYPNGVCVTFINDCLASAYAESLDDHWTLLENPLSDYLHFDPLGQGLVSVQDITNDLVSLTLQTIEHGIGQTFADPAILDFKAYEQTEVVPGGIFPAVAKSGKSLQEGFHELRTATLSGEVLPFSSLIQSMGQQVSGALPSLWGGNLGQGASETASQYSMSRAQALQRLQNTWKTFNTFWKTIFGKVIPAYIKDVKDDERDVQLDDNGNFVNVLIRKAELEGKIGKVELDANENLPLTWSQVKDTVEKLLMNGNPEIVKIISAPENAPLLHDALGLTDFYVPGEDDVIRQNDEIRELLNSEPIPTGDPELPEVPAVEIDPDYDNHAVQFEVCRKWILSEAGKQAKVDNPNGYKNVLLHGKAHLAIMQQQMAMQAAQGAAPAEKPNKLETQEAPITGEADVPQVH